MKKPKSIRLKYPRPHIDDSGFLSGVVAVDLDEIIGKDTEGFLDLLSMKMTDTDLLMEHRYEIVGFDAPDTVYLEVSGDPSMVCDNSDKFNAMWVAMEKKWDAKNKRRKRCDSAA